MTIDEDVSGSSSIPNLQFVLHLKVVVSEGEKGVRRALAENEANHGRAEEASGRDNFVDFMGGLENETGGQSERFTFADFLQRADLLSETVLGGVVDTPVLPLC